MSLFIESIRLNDGSIERLIWHQQRMEETIQQLFHQPAPRLQPILSGASLPIKGLFKIRLLYNTSIQKMEVLPYQIPVIETFQAVYDNTINYPWKYSDRTAINKLFLLRREADDILIIKNGLVTDTRYCNIIFHDGKQWHTPLQPLLKGTMRQYLLSCGVIQATEIGVQDLQKFKKAKLINALMGFDGPEIPISRIRL
ncbi:MAG: aminotransferase class IV [Bacteroidales bacterium]|nr:aminotransferase class IV [Bacteroidales bacterium]MDD3010271.1 aminotransferase class IV [Bacteroidales bacterium]MDY0286689.1 aminotransferase class IV [Bacteroidales bacterium]HPE87396.1 aminotransferase class IV [Bacteroidales bacterium]